MCENCKKCNETAVTTVIRWAVHLTLAILTYGLWLIVPLWQWMNSHKCHHCGHSMKNHYRHQNSNNGTPNIVISNAMQK